MYPEGKLTVIGAGPGDPELITLKALRVLEQADVVLYDALVSTELLAHAPRAECIFVGKRKGCVSFRQPQINDLIVARGQQGKHVVRLKGGDPFVFGRGAEEMAHAAAHGLEVAVVPGISSGLSVPASQHIPVTLRGVAEGFWVITGTTREHALSKDVALAAQSSATVVILMGMSKLAEITRLFQASGKGDTPVAVIQEGTTSRERMCVGTVDSIVDLVAREGLSNPAVIVIGETVRHRERTRQTVSGLEGVATATETAGAGTVFTHPTKII
ncbi:uroporphyrinogen-III C-methyltransferase [Robiginitalea sp. SC105]|uniref:uroporphyrinogen-III C-methyltransferase n=1 Tax=Robiginitalea sp. SC105 TaxID=2762332 RepID=UPI001639E538|nr:uroporphyrinogen-III C-methyltransferase [Robiginitalea sp. SC105]MBC2838933.1 uroporphyrinogen-III C-methyltransferase [Robiginitalea sp. SC105]